MNAAGSNETLLMPVREAARLLGITEKRAYARVADGSFPEGIVIRLGRSIFFSRPRVLAWLGDST